MDRALDPAQQGVDPGDELSHAERLGEVVVGACLQPGDPVRLLLEGIIRLQEKIAGEDIREKWSGKLTTPASAS